MVLIDSDVYETLIENVNHSFAKNIDKSRKHAWRLYISILWLIVLPS